MDPASIVLWCALPLAVAVTLDSLEVIADRRQLRADGLFGLPALVTGRPRTLLQGPFAAPLRRLFAYPVVLAIPLAQIAAAGLLVAAAIARTPLLMVLAGLAAIAIVAARMLSHLRNQGGLDGSNHMILTASTVLAAVLLVPDPQAKAIAVYYLAAQLLLCYVAAGSPRRRPDRRSGETVPQITSTLTFGTPRVGVLLGRDP